MYTSKLLQFFILIVVILKTSTNTFSQNTKTDKHYINNKKHWLVELPIWVPGFRGQLSYPDASLSSSGNSKEKEFERLNNQVGLEFYLVGRVAAQYNKLWTQADIFSGEVSSAVTYTSLIGTKDSEIIYLKIQGTIPRLVVGYSIFAKTNKKNFKLEVIPYAGMRYVGFHIQSTVFDSKKILNTKLNWFEPLLGVYVPLKYKRIKIEIQADYGTTGTKGSLAVSNRYRYRISKLIDIQLGWTLISLTHKGTIEEEELKAKIRLFGPTAGVGFNF
jgi:hypothetical protein